MNLKEFINYCPKCFICGKDFHIYYNFTLSYNKKSIFTGLGEKTVRLKITDNKLIVKDLWSIDIESGEIKGNIKEFNNTLTSVMPLLKKKCSTCDVRIYYELKHNKLKWYNIFPELEPLSEAFNFTLTPKLRVNFYQNLKNSTFFIYSDSGECIHTFHYKVDFSNLGIFKNIKSKIKMVLAFM